MCYFDQTRWACGYWRWGQYRQQCNKEYRMGETCGLKLVYETKFENDVCKLCHDMEKKQRRYDKMYHDVRRWQREANRSAIIETTFGEMQDISGQIYRMNEEHEFRLQALGGDKIMGTASFASRPRSFPITGTGPLTMPAPIPLPFHGDNSINHHWGFETAPLSSPNSSSSFYTGSISRNGLGVDTSSSSLPPNPTSLRAPNIRSKTPPRDKITSQFTLDSEDEDQIPSGKTVVASEPFGESSQTPAFTDLHRQHISQPKEVSRTLDFDLSPSLKQIESFICPLSDSTDRVVAFTCLVNWQILAVYKTELEPGADLRKVVTLTGTPACAELNTCNQFMNKIWDSTAMMEIVAKFVENPSTRHDIKVSENVEVTIANMCDDEAGWDSLSIAVTPFRFRGPLCEVAILLQQLAWLAAAFALPTRDILTVSVPLIETTRTGMFEMHLRKVLPGQDGQFCLFRDLDNTQCWHHLLRGAVLAYGFPTSNRHEGLGLEVPFDLMLGLADIRTQINAGDKTILLGGSGIMLYPTKRLSGGMQWHCALADDEDKDDHTTQLYDSAVAITENNMEEFPSQRMFLGYYPQAEVLLGTRELVDSNGLQATESKFPLSPPRAEFANEGTLTGGFSVKGILNMNLSGKYVMTKTLRISLGGRGFHELVDEAEQQPVIVYDGETKSAWLVSELSIILHLALSYLSSPKTRDRRQTGCKQLEGEWPLLPYAEPCSDGGREARRVCKQPENCRLELWAEEETKNKTFGDVIEDLLKDFQSVRDGIITQGKATRLWPMPKYGLRGWEYTDFLGRKTHFSQKEVPREEHYASWWELAKEKNTLVILGNGFGSLIRPKASSKSPFGLVNIPPGSRLLVASQPCMLMMMPFVDPARPVLGSLEWRSIAKHQRSCNCFCDKTSCFSIQILRAKPSLAKDYTERPRERVLSAQAVIFGECEYYHKALLNAMFMIGSPLCTLKNR